MSDAGDEDKGRNNPAGGRAPLTLKSHTGVVRQSFSHGRSKTVAVEIKRRRPGMDERPAEQRPRPQAPLPTSSARESAQGQTTARPQGGG